MKDVLITGGLGFVGSHLADSLLREGRRVTIVDNLVSNAVPPEAYSGRCEVLELPIEESFDVLCAASGRHFDEIYHLACVVGPAGVLAHAGNIAKSAIMSGDVTTNLALDHNARLILASTSEVYGRAGTLDEGLDCIVSSFYTVRLEYAAAKLTSEIAALNKAKVTKLQVNVVRPFNIAGPRQLPDGGFVLPRFVVSALLGTPLTVFGDGTQIRAFTDVRDIVSGLISIMRSTQNGMVFNLGNPSNEISISKLANEVLRLTQSHSILQMVDPKELFGPLYEEGIERVPCVKRVMEALSWRPKYSLENTILDVIAFYRSRPDLVRTVEFQGVAS